MKKLEEVTHIEMGQCPPGDSYNADGEGMPLINGPTEFGKVSPITIQWTNKPTKICHPGDILYCVRGATTGKMNIADKKYCIGRGVASFTAKTVDSHYLFHYLEMVRPQIESKCVGSAIKGVSGSTIRSFFIPVPPSEIQCKIAAILDRVEETKQLRTEANELTRKLLQSVFLEMFGDPLENPLGWEKMAMDDLCYQIRDGEHRTPVYSDVGVPFVTATNLTGESIDFYNTKKLSPQVYQEFSKRAKPEVGDILMSKDGTIGATQVVENPIDFGIFVSVILFKLKKNIVNPYYLKNLLASCPIQKEINKRVKGVAIKHIHLNEIRSLTLPIPPMEKQMEFERIEQQYRQIRQNQVKSIDVIANLDKLATIKAFTGELVA